MCPMFKKGDQLECQNTLLNTAYKVFSNIVLFQSLQPYVDKTTGSYQCRFRSGKSASDQIRALRQIMEKMTEKGVSTFGIFVDFEAACGSIDRNLLFKEMEDSSYPAELTRIMG